MSPDYGLSAEQYRIMIGTKNLLLTACPGSGKTRSVAARAAWLQSISIRFALLSHTNVGATEIAGAVLRDHGITVASECFVGTLHSFFAKYILRPFGHLVTGASQTMQMDADAVRSRDAPGLVSSDYRFTLDGNVETVKKNGDSSPATLARVKALKDETAASGFVGYDDALYWCWRVMTDHPNIAQALAARFDEVLVDEAQDTSLLQIACLEALKGSNLDSLVLVGDFDQSIYGFSGASPDRCVSFALSVALTPVAFRENWRSSQKICDLTSKFRSNSTPDKAVGKNKDCPLKPKLIAYDLDAPSDMPRILDEVVGASQESISSKVILVRSNSFADRICDRHRVALPDWAKTLVNSRNSINSPSLSRVRDVEKLILRRIYPTGTNLGYLDEEALRSSAVSVIDSLPPLTGTMGAWLKTSMFMVDAIAKKLLPSSAGNLSAPVISNSLNVSSAEGYASSFENIVRVDSVHSAKGESHDAVMLVAEAPKEDWHTPEAQNWSGVLSGRPISEEHRVFYVAVTRARILLALALPSSTPMSVVRAFEAVGFEQ